MNPAISRNRRVKSYENAHSQSSQSCSISRAGGKSINVGENERQMSMLGGGVLAAYGLMRGSLTGLALAAIGGALLYRGYSGHCQLYDVLGHSTAGEEHDHLERHRSHAESMHPQAAP